MNEFSEMPAKVSGIKQVLGRVGRTTKQIAQKALEAMDPIPPVPADKIDPQITAQRLYEHMGNPLAKTVSGNEWVNPFSLRDVMAALGHVPLFITQNHFDVFPQECEAAGKALQELVNGGALEIVPQEEADRYNQRVYWRVVDEAKLRKVAQEKPLAKR